MFQSEQEAMQAQAGLEAEELVEELLVRETQLTSQELHAQLHRDFIVFFSTPAPKAAQ